MSASLFSPLARWIWPDGQRIDNRLVVFRRNFCVDAPPAEAVLRITADTRYEVFVNGAWLGFGPARGWRERWFVDQYCLAGLLKPGHNTIAVSVHEWGLGTYQYIDAAPGLLAEVFWNDASGRHSVPTGKDWRAADETGRIRHTGRISCQQGFEEVFDARMALGDWTQPDYDDSEWAPAIEGAREGEGPHPALELRDIPLHARAA